MQDAPPSAWRLLPACLPACLPAFVVEARARQQGSVPSPRHTPCPYPNSHGCCDFQPHVQSSPFSPSNCFPLACSCVLIVKKPGDQAATQKLRELGGWCVGAGGRGELTFACGWDGRCTSQSTHSVGCCVWVGAGAGRGGRRGCVCRGSCSEPGLTTLQTPSPCVQSVDVTSLMSHILQCPPPPPPPPPRVCAG